ncbi:MAG TPA: L,D-transpeptidase [Bacteroidales bacterium]|nr:L,D-transpeptidase [Bacteroidales bacterium]
MIRLIPESPAQEMKHARECLSDAARSNADTYSSKLYNEAKNNYDSALVNWKKQNQRFIYFRDYERVRMFASMAAQKSIKAKGNSIANTTSLKEQITEKLDTLGELVSELNRLFTAYPLESETRNRISKGKMLLEEAEVAFNRGHYHQSSRNLKDAEYLLSSSYENAYSNLKNYFKSYSKWKTWSEKTIKESKKNGDYSIIIDKFSRKLTVYQKGVKKQEFETELGKNWVGDKRVRGDHATPEGMYKITKKLDSNKTKYYKALLLDYPNEEDLETFKKEVSKGTLPRSAKIGGLIEIHGNGGKGIDWTEGCIALTDREMDVLFKLAKVGTPVTIIGSSQDLAYILKK